MGVPQLFYRRALQLFAWRFAAKDGDFLLAKKMSTEESEEILENYILQKKGKIKESLFFYAAGITRQNILQEAYAGTGDGLNACFGGLIEFEHFIGLIEEGDN